MGPNAKTPCVTIGAVGDVMPGDSYYYIGHGVRSKLRQMGPDFVFERAAAQLAENDLNIGNLECVISNVGLNPRLLSSIRYRGPTFV